MRMLGEPETSRNAWVNHLVGAGGYLTNPMNTPPAATANEREHTREQAIAETERQAGRVSRRDRRERRLVRRIDYCATLPLSVSSRCGGLIRCVISLGSSSAASACARAQSVHA